MYAHTCAALLLTYKCIQSLLLPGDVSIHRFIQPRTENIWKETSTLNMHRILWLLFPKNILYKSPVHSVYIVLAVETFRRRFEAIGRALWQVQSILHKVYLTVRHHQGSHTTP